MPVRSTVPVSTELGARTQTPEGCLGMDSVRAARIQLCTKIVRENPGCANAVRVSPDDCALFYLRLTILR